MKKNNRMTGWEFFGSLSLWALRAAKGYRHLKRWNGLVVSLLAKTFPIIIFLALSCGMAGADIQIKTGQFTMTSGTGNLAITGVGFQPKAYILIMTKNASDNADSASGDGMGISIGMTDGTRQFCMSASNQNNVATSNVGRRAMSDKVMCNIDSSSGTQAILGEAGHVSMDAGGFTINRTTTFTQPTSPLVEYIAFGGSSVSARVDTVDLNNVVNQLVDVTNVGFTPDVVLTSMVGYFSDTLDDSNNDAANLSFGWAVNPASTSGGTTQLGYTTAMQDAQSTSKSQMRFENAWAGCSYLADAFDTCFEINTFDASGFSVTTRNVNAASGILMGYLALDLGTTPNVYSLERSARTSTGNDVVTGTGFTPIFLLGIGSAGVTTSQTSTNGASMSIGLTNGTSTYTASWYDQRAVSPTTSLTRTTSTQFFYGYATSGTVDYTANYSSLDSNGWTLNYGDGASGSYKQGFLAIGASTPHAVYYSVGSNTNNLKQGSGNVSITSSAATFTVAQANNVGQGDEVQAGGNKYYISGRTSATLYTVTTRTGSTPSDLASTSLTGIYRSFNTLTTAEANSTDATHLNTADLTSLGVSLNWAMYNDSKFNELVTVDGYTTSAANYLRIFAPRDSFEVGTSQRHTGKEGTGMEFEPTGSYTYVLNILDDHVHIEGIEIDAENLIAINDIHGITASQASGGELWIDDVIVHDIDKESGDSSSFGALYGIDVGGAGTTRIRNTIINDFINSKWPSVVSIQGIALYSSGSSYIYNCNIFDLRDTKSATFIRGINVSSGTVTVDNTYVGKIACTTCTETDFYGTMTQSNNVSADTSATGTTGDSKTSYDNYFYDTGTSAPDLHLKHHASELWGLSGADLDSDANLPVTDDLEGDARPASSPDIGADQVANDVPNAPGTPYCEGGVTPVSSVSDTTPEFSGICLDQQNDGCTDYEIEVNTQSDFLGTVMWDTGKVAFGATVTYNTRSADISYAGSALSMNGTTYYWRMHFWGQNTPNGAGDWTPVQQFTTKQSGSPTAPQTPYCEGSTTPVSNILDATPEFSAICDDPEFDNCTHYEIEVNKSDTFNGTVMWDTGQVAFGANCTENTRCPDISYAGTSLAQDGTIYYWRIHYWGVGTSSAGDWSATQQFNLTTNNAPNAPLTPQAEGATNPTGVVDLTPEFDAEYDDTDGADTAIYYQIQVNTASDFSGTTMWDSTKTSMTAVNEGSRTAAISYAGTALATNNTIYYWRIRLWDNKDGTGAWSATQNFRMADINYVKLTFTQEALDAYQFDVMSPPYKVAVQTNGGVTNVSDNSTSVTIGFAGGGNPGNAVLFGTTTKTVVAGVATFSDLRISKPGVGYILQATASGLTSAQTVQ